MTVCVRRRCSLFMAALCSRCSHYILQLGLLSSSFFLAYSQRSEIGCLPYFHTWYGLSANLECVSEMAARGSLKYRTQKLRKKIAICALSHNFVGLSSQLRHVSTYFNGFRVLASLLQRRRLMEANQTLHDAWPSPGLVHYTACPRKNGLP